MPERYYSATFNEDELSELLTLLEWLSLQLVFANLNDAPGGVKLNSIIKYLQDVKEEGDRAMKEEQYEN